MRPNPAGHLRHRIQWSARHALVAAAMLIASASHAWPRDPGLEPDAMVRSVVSDVLAILKSTPTGDRESREKALALAKEKILPHIDFERMTRLAVGRAWRSADTRQRQELVAQFGSLITRVYSAAIDDYSGQDIQVDPLNRAPGADDVIVRSHFRKTGAPPVEVNYAMWKTAEGWKVYDITVENVSLVITYRSQFGEEISRSGIDGLIRLLTEKNRNATK
jgi:phospholipid transport system substrate-binding protein